MATQTRPMSPAEQNARAIVNRLSLGMPAQVVAAMLEAAERVNWQVDARASVSPANVSRTFTFASDGDDQENVRFGKPLIASLITARGQMAAGDDTTKASIRWQNGQQTGYWLGDKDYGLNIAILAEVSTPIPQLKPWVLFPLEDNFATVTLLGATGAATVILGLHGIWLHGFGATA